MPTFQTTPYNAWVFPDQAIRMNRAGVSNTTIPTRRVESEDFIVGNTNQFYKNAVDEAYARLSNNKLKEESMLGRRNTTAWTQRPFDKASRYYKKNGKFPGQTITSGGFLTGGTGLITRDGREWFQEVIKNRINELNDIQSGSFRGAPSRIFIEPTTNEVDTYLQQIIDSISVVSIPSSLIELATKALTSLLRIGDKVRETDLARIKETITNIQENILGLLASPGTSPSAEKRAILKSVQKVIDRMEVAIKDLAKVVGETADVRVAAVKDIQTKFGKQLGEKYSYTTPIQQATTAMTTGLDIKREQAADNFLNKLKENEDQFTIYLSQMNSGVPYNEVKKFITTNYGADIAKQYTNGMHNKLAGKIKPASTSSLQSIQQSTPAVPATPVAEPAPTTSVAVSTPQTTEAQPGFTQQEASGSGARIRF